MVQKGLTPIIVVTILAIIMAFASYFIYKNYPYGAPIPPQQEIACTMDAKICPDGSSVGRSGPRCEFAACPKIKSTTIKEASDSGEISKWRVYTNEFMKYSIKYPQNYTLHQLGQRDIIIENDPLKTTNNPETAIVIYDRTTPEVKDAEKACEIEICSNINYGSRKELVELNNAIGVKLFDPKDLEYSALREDYYLNSPNKEVVVRIIVAAKTKEDSKMIQQILSTFKFTQ